MGIEVFVRNLHIMQAAKTDPSEISVSEPVFSRALCLNVHIEGVEA